MLVSLTVAKLSSILFRDVYVGGKITKRSKGMNNRNQDCAMSREREGMRQGGTHRASKGLDFRLIFFKPYIHVLYTLLCVYTFEHKLEKKTKPSKTQLSKQS